jgi:hypothetical protein
MNNFINQFAPGVKLTKIQLVAIWIQIGEACLIPLVVVVFIGALSFSSLTYIASSLNKPPSLSFLRDQYDFLLTRGVDQSSAELPLRLFELLIWLLITMIFLRVVSSPFLFGLVDWGKRFQAAGTSIVKVFLACLLAAYSIWASVDMRGSSAVPVVASMLKRAPQAYVSFEAFIFVSGPILFVECLIMLFDNALMSARKRKSSQPSEASKR